MASLDAINVIVSSIMTDAAKKIGEALIDRAEFINCLFNDARGCFESGDYVSGLELAAKALKYTDDLLDYADYVMPDADGAAWECVRDALGTVSMEKAPVQNSVVMEYEKRIKRYVSPTFGNSPKLYICYFKDGHVTEYHNWCFVESHLDSNQLKGVEMFTLGAGYDYNMKNGRWVLDALINPKSRPDLNKYM